VDVTLATAHRTRVIEPATQALVACGGLAVAMAIRVALGGSEVAASTPAAGVFACLVLVAAIAAGWRPARPALSGVAIGAGGAVVLVGFALQARDWHMLGPTGAMLPLVAWSVVVVCVAVAEEILLRGVVLPSLARSRGPVVGLLLSSIVFAVLHVPLYGVGALPLDFAVGLWLGGLRLLTGGVTASATAHALADLAAGWVL
jgi:membrane protease YdiL (CAAX protease family)